MKKRAGGRVLGRLLARDQSELMFAQGGRATDPEPEYVPSYHPVTGEEVD